ncbi:hypothetical protein BDF20DRAFT_822616 [Mycotypha africana]|uniref:uncharacterized protein n=1 Tax=Mycotypha africana TaxID=64632 RepID=UPI002301059D|nr:uncharacterized protein BDF20DRAFT_822616 [Mycotypha africana]KAI8975146.1 hypothetical protein BDF20DRAFT_822616 [Mycotypha africana]
MFNSNVLRNPWADDIERQSRIEQLKKSIREQHILLDTVDVLNDAYTIDKDDRRRNSADLEDLKSRIKKVTNELQEKQTDASHKGLSTQSLVHLWSQYLLNMRQLEDIAEQRKTLTRELDYLINTSIRNVEKELLQEANRLSQLKEQVATNVSNVSLSSRGSDTNIINTENMTDSERIRAKAQAMVAARLNKLANNSPSPPPKNGTRNHNSELLSSAFEKQQQHKIDQILSSIRRTREEADQIISVDLMNIEHSLEESSQRIKEKNMFEQGLYVDHEVAQFIDQLKRPAITKRKSNASLLPPTLPKYNALSARRSSATNTTPPPVPTSRRPGTPRSEADIKAAAKKRIEERRQLFMKKENNHQYIPAPSVSSITNDHHSQQPSEAERAAQERMRQAEAEARVRLEIMREKRNQLRKEAAEAEEKKKKAAAEAAAAAEAEMLAEKKRKIEEKRQAELKRKAAEAKRLAAMDEEKAKRNEQQQVQLEKDKQLRKWKEDRAAEEERQMKARQAAEQAAREKRLRQAEIERRERDIEQARQDEIERRRKWEEAELQRKMEEELKIRQQQEEEEERLRVLEEEKEKARREEELIKKQLEEEQALQQQQATQQPVIDSTISVPSITTTNDSAAQPINTPFSPITTTTAGTSGYGIDVEDEVNFSIIYRVVTLYEYQGIREDDLSFEANETIKAHPSKDKASDWWYGTSLVTNQVGFFPRTYVEVVEEVQPFQDEDSDWWYGTNEETQECGYFPKTFVEKITSGKSLFLEKGCSTAPIAIPTCTSPTDQNTLDNTRLTVSDDHLPRGSSVPNTPIMKKFNLGVSKTELTRRRRAASTVSTVNNSHISTPQPLVRRSSNTSENLELVSWASTMDPIELDAIPPEERKRQEAIFELIATERSYLSDLQMIVNIFFLDSGKYLSEDERDVVFSNIDDLLICNTALLSDMETQQREQCNVIDKIDNLKCYSTYCRNQSYATKFLQKKREEDQWFEVFLKTAQTRPECRSLDLSHFLLEPVQRITRYPLLLRQILNCTPERHADHSLVKSALSISQRILEDVNEETRLFENAQKLSELSRLIDMETYGKLNITGREFIMDGALFKAKSGRKLHGFLFNDILILAEPLKTLNVKGYLYTLYREPFPLEKVSVRQQQSMTLKHTFSNSDECSFQIVSGSQVIGVKTSSAHQKRQWISQIQHYSALKQYNN